MAYVTGNPKTKKELKQMVLSYQENPDQHTAPMIFGAGMFDPKRDGTEYIEGPQYPQPHRWYAQVQVKNGVIVKVLS